MAEFTYTITDEIGIHARPAGMLVSKAKGYDAKITLECNGKSAEMTKLMAIMAMGIKCNDTVTVTTDGADADKAATELEEFFKNNL
ncbi:HPr family phosphocarrier protein [Anaerosporobacter sp.]|uniref:HPr family phosphocarrier protein n=1 Tax=Anaerosporobacter sp. TaxID=1872529 RepID=UPI00286F70BE|nr:HPr family phosphocarrier protein [Anaerosporobacter sp.]